MHIDIVFAGTDGQKRQRNPPSLSVAMLWSLLLLKERFELEIHGRYLILPIGGIFAKRMHNGSVLILFQTVDCLRQCELA
jgi:hypothetical protein